MYYVIYEKPSGTLACTKVAGPQELTAIIVELKKKYAFSDEDIVVFNEKHRL